MSKLPNEEADRHETPRPKSTAVLLLSDIADTTWRMFVPTVGLATLGFVLDQQLDTTPWLFILGFVLGCYITGVLIKRLFKKL